MSEYSPTFYLFAQPSFLSGMARVADFGLVMNELNSSPNGMIADELALWSDWLAVGEDMEAALREFEAQEGFITNE